MSRITRRRLLQSAGAAAATAALAACQPVVVEKAVEKVVKETVVVKEAVEVEKEVTRVVQAAAPTGPTNALGVTLPADALPLDQQYRLIAVGRPGEQAGGSYGHEMESLYNRAYPLGYGSEVLTQLDIERNPQGVACESWSIAEDGLAWDFKLRKELKFADGKPITAHDWVWTFRRSFEKGYDFGWFFYDILNAQQVLAGELPPEELGMEAMDDFTLRIKTKEFVPYIPSLGVWAFVAPPQAYEQYGENWAVNPQQYIASGPWTLKEFERGVKWTFDLNPEYKGVNRPYYTQLRARTLPTGLPAYIAGDIQQHSIGIDTPAGEVAIVNANPILRSESHPQPSLVTWYIGFNTTGKFKPLDDINVRMALSRAIDKEKIIGEVGRGFAYPAWGLVPNGFPGNSHEMLKGREPNQFDPQAAKELLAKAGFPNGQGFPKFELWIRNPQPYMVTLCEAVQAAWKEHLNIDVDLYPTDHQSFTARTFRERDIPIYFVGYSMDFYDPATFMSVFRSGGRHPHDDPAYDEAFNTGNSTRDPRRRLELLSEAEAILVDHVGYIFLIQPFSVALWPCNLAGEGIRPNSAGFQSDTAYGGGANPWVGAYWSDSDCRKRL
ncbi:MAG: peptide ABC transporter substrate-binding protein [Chloroflexi bacterium]|nr:peptide ABC transporter substrate-binding protein [Chloroflexota bacterium]